MGVVVRIELHLDDVLSQLSVNKETALAAAGEEAVGLTVDKMTEGNYVYRTGALARDVQWDFKDENTVCVGNTLNYAPFVHDGHNGHAVYLGDKIGFRVLPGGHTAERPYLKNALLEGQAQIQEVFEEALKTGF